MKYIVLVGDGMGDYPIAELGGKTPLAAAQTPHMDWLANHGELGLVKTIPQGCETGSDTANLSLLGYDPASVNVRRAPLEAASLRVNLAPSDVAFRCNLVTLSNHNGVLTMDDYSAGHISTDEGGQLIEEIDRRVGNETFRFYPGVSYRHLMVWHGGTEEVETTPPHDITGQAVQPYLERLSSCQVLLELMNRTSETLKSHPINQERIKKGLKPASHIWLWGQGHAPKLEAFQKRTGLKGAIISAVDLLKGIGVYIGLEVIQVPGATGYLDTDYEAKAKYALSAIREVDFVYVHVEAPDEAGHAGLLDKKISAIEAFDTRVVGTILKGLKGLREYRIMVTTDHYTPVSVRTHTTEPVPFAIYGTDIRTPSQISGGFSEVNAHRSGLVIADGYTLIDHFIRYA
ncbi:MAG: cofactor-independent phosphoglycerate mutase [Deltaproteobacteria bacterium]|nr:cofactor-independent phosphoglycerate mutase [Deltaproteobacteria bacterium]